MLSIILLSGVVYATTLQYSFPPMCTMGTYTPHSGPIGQTLTVINVAVSCSTSLITPYCWFGNFEPVLATAVVNATMIQCTAPEYYYTERIRFGVSASKTLQPFQWFSYRYGSWTINLPNLISSLKQDLTGSDYLFYDPTTVTVYEDLVANPVLPVLLNISDNRSHFYGGENITVYIDVAASATATYTCVWRKMDLYDTRLPVRRMFEVSRSVAWINQFSELTCKVPPVNSPVTTVFHIKKDGTFINGGGIQFWYSNAMFNRIPVTVCNHLDCVDGSSIDT
jgi:hypothetical protein